MPASGPGPVPRSLAGALALAVVMGIGRFAYTALLPGVQHGLGFDDAAAGGIASANLVGYLLGVVWARDVRDPRDRGLLLRLGLAASAASTALVVTATTVAPWVALRFVGGVASGLVFVLVAAAVLATVPAARATALAGILYSGVGAGMALSGAVAALTPADVSWRGPWLVLGACGAVAAIPAWAWLARGAGPAVAVHAREPSRAGVSLGRLGVSYTLQGLGYIVSGTFAVTAVKRVPGLEGWAPWVWVVAGLAAAPAAPLWTALARRTGARRALVTAFGVQVVGMALPALSAQGWAAVTGALLFGGTFMGITTVTMALARELDPEGGARSIATLTILYGVAQAVAPTLAGLLSDHLGDPRPAVLAAAAAVLLGGAVLVPPRR